MVGLRHTLSPISLVVALAVKLLRAILLLRSLTNPFLLAYHIICRLLEGWCSKGSQKATLFRVALSRGFNQASLPYRWQRHQLVAG